MKALYRFQVVLRYPEPPSSNELYVRGFRGKTMLSAKGRAYKDAMTAEVVAACMTLPWAKAIELVYAREAYVRLKIRLHGELYNKAWTPFGKTKKGERQSPYKKQDGTNYIKATEDAVKDGTGIDDNAHLSVRVVKVHGPVRAVEVIYEVVPLRSGSDDKMS